MYKYVLYETAQWQMLRVYLPHLKYFQRRSRSFCQVHHYNSFVTRLCSLTDEHKLSSTVQNSSLLNGHLLEMLEDLQKKKRVKSKQDQLVSSFNIVRQIQMETDPDELLEIYNALKNETNVDHENLAILSAQVALFNRLAFTLGQTQAHQL